MWLTSQNLLCRKKNPPKQPSIHMCIHLCLYHFKLLAICFEITVLHLFPNLKCLWNVRKNCWAVDSVKSNSYQVQIKCRNKAVWMSSYEPGRNCWLLKTFLIKKETGKENLRHTKACKYLIYMPFINSTQKSLKICNCFYS